MRKLVLKEDSHASAPFKVKKMINTLEWKIGERLTREKVKNIVRRLGPSSITVEIH